jgi:hypothetical protein
MLRVMNRVPLAALAVAFGLAASSLALAQDCPHCGPHGTGQGPHFFHGGGDGHVGGHHVYDAGYYQRGLFGPPSGAGDCAYRHYGSPDLFRQYYVPNNCGGVSAGMYPAPLPVPPHVGHTYYTYEPLYPHEFLYPHKRTYHRYYDDGRGLTRTKVTWMR